MFPKGLPLGTVSSVENRQTTCTTPLWCALRPRPRTTRKCWSLPR
ncbi:MAG: hypothetical protein ACLU0O_06735 [Collinsella sp.]